ncbi:MAG TPA: ABC transporter permease [Gemmatimonadales bacterium]|jgi:putative ABC transport system permease protein|nr:ABC transporter permease [Gemmatimonadales bacterium]
MSTLRALLARIAGLFTGHRADDELREELQSHVEMETAENIKRGLPPEEARRQALLASGGVTQAAEAVHDRRGIPWIESAVADLRYAVRALRHSPAFTAVVVITLALGIGANTAIFSVVRGVLLKPLPHRDGNRLVYLRQSMDGPAGENVNFSVPEITDFRGATPALGGIAEYSPWSMVLQGDHDATRINIGLVTGNYFDVMGLSPIEGRLTRPSDDGPGVPPVMVLTYDFWMRRFGGDRGIVGKTVRLDGPSATVIGVLQPAPFFPDRIEALMNMVISPHHLSAQMVQGRTHRMTEMVARLAPGATLDQARGQVAATYARMQHDHPDAYDPGSHYRVAVIPFKNALGDGARPTLWLLMGVAFFVLIISAANVVNLTLMRGVRRERELVVRAALGAGVLRLRRLLLAENFVLTLTGALCGVGLAVGGVRLLVALAARYSARASEIHLDLVTLSFALGLSAAVALLLSFVAALPREGTLGSWISAAAGRLSGGLRKQRLQRALVVTQIAVSVVLLAGAGLLTRTMIRLAEVSTGLKTEQVLAIDVPLLSPSQLGNPTGIMQADGAAKENYDRMVREIAAIPGVIDVGVGSNMPLNSSQAELDVKAEGLTPAVGEASPRADLRTADPEYFRAAGIPLLSGRPFSLTDRMGSGRVVILNRMLADRLFPGQDPLGRHVAWTGDVLRFTPWTGDWRTIVGVVGNTQDGGLDAPPRPAMYMPYAAELAFGGSLVVRADSNVSSLVGRATAIVRRIAPTSPIDHVLTIAQIKDESVAPRRLNAALVSAFGLLAVLIAAVGIAGVLAFSVSSRTSEIGIRMSLGADRGQVLRMILGEGGVLLALGLGLGVAGAFIGTGVIRGLLFGVTPRDPVTLGGVALLMAAIGLVACWIPAARAARVDPVVAMRAS